jgi:peptidoglycan/LPS O-acetylase OafA/YrhL
MAGAPSPATGDRRLAYLPALDGLRGLAVAAVLLFHSDLAWAAGGFLGVSLFFTLSGFLITSLVVSERETTGRVSLRTFWARRARRLIPASVLALGLALLVTATVVPAAQRLEAVGDIRAALLNLANWRFIWRSAPYADLHLVPSPVQHYWSLAIEEQFYLAFPLIAALALRWRARGLAVALALLTGFALVRQLSLHDIDRVYFGTDTRAAELAIGGLLALGRNRISALVPAGRAWLADLVGLPALLATLLLWWHVQQRDADLYRGGLVAVAVLSAVLIFGAVEGQALRRLLSLRPLVELGKISYGVYLFHFPMFMVLTPARTSLGAAPLLAGRLLVTLIVAVASYHLLERPIRTGQALSTRVAPFALAGAFALIAVVSLGMRQGTDGQDVTAATAVTVVPAVPVTAATVAADAATPTTTTVAPTPDGDAAASPPPTTTPPAPRAPRVVVVGDSTAGTNGAGLRQWGISTGRLEVATVSSSGCASLLGERFKVREGYEFVPHGCDVLFATAVDTARQLQADAFVVFIGSSQLADWKFSDLDGWHHVGEAEIDARYPPAVGRAVATLQESGIPILWADTPTPAWDLEVFGQQLGGGELPGTGPVTLNDPERAAHLNAMDRATVPVHPMATIWPYAAELAGPDGQIPQEVRPDGLHVSPEAMAQLADRSLFDALRTAYRTVIATGAPGLTPPADQAWSR